MATPENLPGLSFFCCVSEPLERRCLIRNFDALFLQKYVIPNSVDEAAQSSAAE